MCPQGEQVKQWKYGLAVYSRLNKGTHKPIISTSSGTLPMDGFGKEEFLYLTDFLKSAGERGWELVSVMEPYPAGFELAAEVEGVHTDEMQKVGSPGDVQWLIFKRENGS
jgi:hypothetical protein